MNCFQHIYLSLADHTNFKNLLGQSDFQLCLSVDIESFASCWLQFVVLLNLEAFAASISSTFVHI
jgi:hypothetical protein